MKLAHKIGLCFIFVAFVCMAIALGVVYVTTRQDISNAIFQDLEASVYFRAQHIKTYLRMSRMALIQTSRSVVLPKALKTPKDDAGYQDALENAGKLLKNKKTGDDSFLDYMLLDATGMVVASSDDINVGLDNSNDLYFLNARKQVFVKDAYFSDEKKIPLMGIATPLFDGQGGGFLGILVGRVKLDELYGILTDRTNLGETGEIFLVNQSGYAISPLRYSRGLFLEQKIDPKYPKLTSVDKSARETTIYRNYHGVSVLGTRGFISGMQWTVMGEIGAKEAFRAMDKMKDVFLLVLFLGSIMAMLLGQFIARMITVPLRKLYRGAQIVGEGNLDYKVAIAAQDEVGDLSRAFDVMTANLKKTTASIDIFNNEAKARQKAEEDLKESEARYFKILYGSDDPTFLISGNVFIDANDAAARMLGCPSKRELLNAHPSSFSPAVQPDGSNSFEKANEMIALAVKKGVHQFEWVHRRVNGELFPVDISLTPIILRGKPLIQCVLVDLTEKKQNEHRLLETQRRLQEQTSQLTEALDESRKSHEILSSMLDDINQMRFNFEQSSKKLELILASTGEGIFGLDKESRHTFVNAQAQRLLGYSEQELIGGDSHALWHHSYPDGSPYPPELCPNFVALRDGKTIHGEEYYWRKDGFVFPVEFTAVPVFQDNKVTGLVVSFRDITERRKNQENISRLTQAIEQSPASVVITNLKGEMEYANSKFYKVSGYAPEDVIGKNPRVLKSGEMTREQYKDLWDTISQGHEWRGEFHNRKKSGELYWESALISPIRNAQGARTHYLAVKEDITELKKAEDEVNKVKSQLVQRDKLSTLGEMATGMAHEINQPLNGIALVMATFRKLMAKKLLNDENLTNGMKDIETCIKRMTQTITHIRVYARQETLAFAAVDLPVTIDSALMLMGEQLRMHEIKVVTKVEPGLPKIQGEPHQLEQVWINLISNARDALEEKQKQVASGESAAAGYEKCLTIELVHLKESNAVRVVFGDNGVGMTEQQRKKALEPFFTTKEVGKGTGLGLSISYGIIQNHKGKIEIASEPGQGASFIIELPVFTGNVDVPQ